MTFEKQPTDDGQSAFAMNDRLEQPSQPVEETHAPARYLAADFSRLVLDQAPCGVLLLDGDAKVLQANTTLKRWLGRGVREATSERELKDALGLDNAATLETVLLAIEAVQKDLLAHSFELKFTRADGSHMVLLAGASAVRSPAGDFLACALSFTDITERARQLQELLGTAERMRSITDRTTARQAYFDADLICRFANRALCSRLGARPEHVLGRSFKDCFDADEVREIFPHVTPDLSADKQTFLIEKQAQDGSTLFLECSVFPDVGSDGGARGVFVEIDDITERRRTEDLVLHANMELEARVARRTAELTRTKRRFSLMAEALQDSCIFFLDDAGRITEWSESAHRLHGFSNENVLG